MKDVTVLGGGMVGVSTALALQARGRDVLLLDRGEPGRETSYGNAGIIQAEAVAPYAVPLVPRKLLSILLGRSREVAWSARAAPAWLAPTLQYLRHSLPRRYAAIVPHYARLIVRATADHAPLMVAAGAEALIRRDGFFQAYRSGRLLQEAEATAAALLSSHGVGYAALDGGALSALEPNLRTPMAGAIHWTGPWSCRDPGGLVARYAALFVQKGGAIEKAEAKRLSPYGAGWRLQTAWRVFDSAEAVVALGPWSPSLLSTLGYRVPMVLKRGYHRHFASTAAPGRPFLDVERAALVAPMDQGVRR